MISSSELNYRNNVPFGVQSVPLSQGGQQTYVPAMHMQGVQDNYVSNRAKKAEYGWLAVPAAAGVWLAIV